jgi:hypothetical protein
MRGNWMPLFTEMLKQILEFVEKMMKSFYIYSILVNLVTDIYWYDFVYRDYRAQQSNNTYILILSLPIRRKYFFWYMRLMQRRIFRCLSMAVAHSPQTSPPAHRGAASLSLELWENYGNLIHQVEV